MEDKSPQEPLAKDQTGQKAGTPATQDATQSPKKKKNYQYPPEHLLNHSVFLSERYSWYSVERLEENLRRRGNLLHFIEKILINKDQTKSYCYYAIYDDPEFIKSFLKKKKLKLKCEDKTKNKTKMAIFPCTRKHKEWKMHREIYEARAITFKNQEDIKNGKVKPLGFLKKERLRKQRLRELGLYDPKKEALRRMKRKEQAAKKREARKKLKQEKKRQKGLKKQAKIAAKGKAKKMQKQLKKLMLKDGEAPDMPLKQFEELGMTPDQIQMMAFFALSLNQMASPPHSAPTFIPQGKNEPTINIKSVTTDKKATLADKKSPSISKKSEPFHPHFFPGSPDTPANTFFQADLSKKRFEGAGIIEDGEECFFKPTETNYYKSNLTRRMHFEDRNLWNVRFNWRVLSRTESESEN